MKKSYFILFFWLFFMGFVHGQVAYYDAVSLAGYIDPTTKVFKSDAASVVEIGKILRNYCVSLPDPPNAQDIKDAFTTDNVANPCYNPILANYLGGAFGQGSEVITGHSKSVVSAIGNLDVTSFADGLAKFLVARAKEELNVAFFRKFQEFIKHYPEVHVIFPATYDMVSQIYSYQYASFLPALRACFHQDMNAFSTHLIELRELTSTDCPDADESCVSRMKAIHTFLNDDPIGRTFAGALIISDQVMQGSNAVEIIDLLANDEICKDTLGNFSNAIRFVNLLSNSLRSTLEGELWVNKSQINKLVGNIDAVKIYMGLLYAKDRMQPIPITFTTAHAQQLTFGKILLTADTGTIQLMRFRDNLRSFGYLASDVSLKTKKLSSDTQEVNDDVLLKFSEYATTLSDLFQHGVTFFKAEDTKLASDVRLFTAILENAAASCYDIKSKNYTSLVLHTSSILDTLLSSHYNFRNDFVKYGNFMANIIEADNSDEVKAAIEAAVLPVGSASIKRLTFSNISLNAYMGLMGGGEWLPALEEDQWAPVFGVTAPVGLAINWGNIGNGKLDKNISKMKLARKSKKSGQSLSLFIPLIDVGALATFRFGDDSSHVASEVKLENIIAPGIYGYWGLGKVPISIGLGVQIGPQLRKINAEEANLEKNFYVRYGLNVAVDIPFFNFYTNNSRNIKDKKKSKA